VGLDPLAGGPKEMAQILRDDYLRWGKVVQERGISAE
jgi:hypothetical protein